MAQCAECGYDLGHIDEACPKCLPGFYREPSNSALCDDCPQCGEPTETLHEGYCERCRGENQRALDEHNAAYERWQELTESERGKIIADRARLG